MAYFDLKNKFSKKRISFIYVFYWLMLAYMVAALVFWFISLTNQNLVITQLKQSQLLAGDPEYAQKMKAILTDEKAKSFQYQGEGATFLILIITSAVFVFRMLRTQLKSARQQKDFMMAITHELKTPIAVTKLNLETMLRRKLDGSQQERLINTTLAEADRLNALCNNMLLLNEMDSAYTLSNEDVDLNELVEECVNEHRTRFQTREFIIESEPDIHIYGDRMLLKLAVNNLLDNAVKYSPKEAAVKVRLFLNEAGTTIEIVDEGEGIVEDELNKIFQKYYRGAKSQAKGTGLGLYVTRQIVKQSRGTLEYRANKPKGSIFAIRFAK